MREDGTSIPETRVVCYEDEISRHLYHSCLNCSLCFASSVVMWGVSAVSRLGRRLKKASDSKDIPERPDTGVGGP